MSSSEENHNENTPEAFEEQIPAGEIDATKPIKEPILGEEVLHGIVPFEDRGLFAITA
jgi:hypothetical protein